MLGIQSKQQQDVRELSSGLRIQSAADDPSGLAISEHLRARSAGLQQGAENAQDANNLLTVAQGAAMQIQAILQRMYGLVISAGSDLQSDDNLAQIQAEIDQLKHEIDSIAQNASFNGVNLFDGSHDTAKPSPFGHVIYETPPPNPDGSIPATTVYNSQGIIKLMRIS